MLTCPAALRVAAFPAEEMQNEETALESYLLGGLKKSSLKTSLTRCYFIYLK